jgi:hypothetical protein
MEENSKEYTSKIQSPENEKSYIEEEWTDAQIEEVRREKLMY